MLVFNSMHGAMHGAMHGDKCVLNYSWRYWHFYYYFAQQKADGNDLNLEWYAKVSQHAFA